ncbi:MAG: ABC transporter substrate-binding protein [Candidatus Bathyarchaeia archaeon]
MKIGLGILVIGIIIVSAAAGAYYTTPPLKKLLSVDLWYESSGHYPQSADQAAVLKAQLERTGLITVNLHSLDWASYLAQPPGTMTVSLWGWTADLHDPDELVYGLLQSAGSSWLGDGYNSTQMDRLVAESRTTTDATQRGQVYHQIQELSLNDSAVIPLYQGKTVAVTKPGVTGVVFGQPTPQVYWWLIGPPPGKDTLVVGTTDTIDANLDPAEDFSSSTSKLLPMIGSPLVMVKPGAPGAPADYIPVLAADYSSSPDGLTWTFNLRKGVKFSDGSEFNAYAAKYSFDRSMTLNTALGAIAMFGYNDIIMRVDAPSMYQLVITLRHPTPWFLGLMSLASSQFVNPKSVPKDRVFNYVEGNLSASNPNDLGPYVLTEWLRQGGKDVELKFDANPNYYAAADGLPKAKHIIYKIYSDPTSLALAMKAGDIDMAFKQLTSTDINAFGSDPNVKVWTYESPFIQYMVINVLTPPFDNPEVRHAIAAAIDRAEICHTVYLGQESPLYSLVPNGYVFHEDTFKALESQGTNFAIGTLQGLGYSTASVNPVSQTWLALVGVGVIVAVVGIAMLLRKKTGKP